VSRPPLEDGYRQAPFHILQPASYTRTFFGSLISWRPGSFGNGNRYFPGSSPRQCHSPRVRPIRSLFTPLSHTHRSPFLPLFFLVPPTSAMTERYPPSMESDRGSIMNALSAMEREDELVSFFTQSFVSRSLLRNRSPLPTVPQLHLLRSQPLASPCPRGTP
jgi:hypothetical protein